MNNLTEVVFILDKSGSMSGLEEDVVGGFNSTIDKQRNKDGKCLISTVLFDNKSTVIHDREDVENIKHMELEDYDPSGCTALIDALGDSIKYIKKVHKIIREEDRPDHTLFIITTDGMENASHKYSSEEVKKIIETQQELGWEFIYLAANIDAVETSKTFGFKTKNSHNFINDKRGNERMFMCMDKVISCVREERAIEPDTAFEELDNDYNKRKK